MIMTKEGRLTKRQKEILEYIKKYEKRSILTSIIMILIAILLIIKPVAMLDTFVTIFGIGILLDGIFSIILYIITDREQKIYSNALVEGIFGIIIASLILINKNVMIAIIPVLVGIWIIIKSITKMQLSFNVRSVNEKSWVLILISSLITLAIGIIILVDPFETMISITMLAGILLLTTGIIDVAESISMLWKLK